MGEASVFATVALPLALVLIMGSLGLSLTPADFKRIFVQPRGVLIGLANLFVLSPLLAFAVAELYGLSAAFAVGLVLLGATPGGTSANLLTHLAKGDTALSVSMTALSSIGALITVPLYLGLAIEHFGASVADDVGMLGISARVFGITVLPLAIGMWIRSRKPTWAAANEGTAKRIAVAAFIVVVGAAVAEEWGAITDNFAALAIAALTLNVLAMAASFTISRLARLDYRQATAVALELGVHNGTVAIAVAATIDTRLAIPAAIYSAFMFLTGGAFAWLMARRNTRPEQEAGARPGIAFSPEPLRGDRPM
jgi:BASS family bile acid:Na+ symporter